jgi:hypothetical protein
MTDIFCGMHGFFLLPVILRQNNIYVPSFMFNYEPDISVSIVTRLKAGRLGFDFLEVQGHFSSPPHPDRLWGPPSLLLNGYRRLFPTGANGA